MSKRITLSPRLLDFKEISRQREDLEKSILLYYSYENPQYAARFGLYTRRHVLNEEKHRIFETELAMVMTLLAAIEASFRVDYLKRCSRRTKDKLSQEFRKLYHKKKRRVSFENDILKLWKLHSDVPASLIGEIRDAFRFRHWLAHGRYWTIEIGREYNFSTVYELARTIEQEFRLEK